MVVLTPVGIRPGASVDGFFAFEVKHGFTIWFTAHYFCNLLHSNQLYMESE